MNEYEAGLEALAKWSARKIAGRCALMYKRINDVQTMYADEERAIIQECKDTADKFGVSQDNPTAMAQVLRLVLGSRNIDTAEPAPLFPEGTAPDENGRLAQAGDGAAPSDPEKRDGPRNSTGEGTGGQPGRPAEDGTPAQSSGRRTRRQARSTNP